MLSCLRTLARQAGQASPALRVRFPGAAERIEARRPREEMAAAKAEGFGGLLSTTLQQLVQNKGKLVEVDHSDSVADAMRVMLEHNVVVVPVAAPPGEWIGAGGTMIMEKDEATGKLRKQYIGMVSVYGVLTHICDTRFLPDVPSRLASSMGNVIGNTLEDLTVWTMSPSTSVLEAMEPLSKGVNRVLVPLVSGMEHGSGVELTEFSPGYRMLTQTDLLRFLMEQRGGHVQEFLDSRTITEVGAVREDIVAVPGHLTLLAALKEIWDVNQVTAVILEPRGEGEVLEVPSNLDGRGKKAITSLSAEDLRGCAPETLAQWSTRPVLEFLRRHEVARKFGLEAAERDDGAALPSPPVSCSPGSTLAEAASKALKSQVHRVWVTGDQGLLLGVVRISDILRVVCEHVILLQDKENPTV